MEQHLDQEQLEQVTTLTKTLTITNTMTKTMIIDQGQKENSKL